MGTVIWWSKAHLIGLPGGAAVDATQSTSHDRLCGMQAGSSASGHEL